MRQTVNPKLSDKLVKELELPSTGNRRVYDSEVRGFGIRITKAGSRAFIFNYRVKGSGIERRYTIGDFPAWTTGGARKEAERLRRLVDTGGDPMGDLHDVRAAPTVADLCDRYEETHMKTKRADSQVEDKAMMKAYIRPRIGNIKVADLRHADCESLHRFVTESGKPIRANRTMALLSKMLSLAIRWELRTDNPARGIERNPENKRERYLTAAEIVRLSDAMTRHPNIHACNAIRLMLLTGARSGEVLSATWDQFDLAGGVWLKPASNTKQKKDHRIPLSAAARTLLSDMHSKQKGEHLFYSRNAKPLDSVRTVWAALCKSAGLSEKVAKTDAKGKPVKDKDSKPVMVREPTVRVHDLRHTYASILASAGQSLPVIGALLGHSVPQTTARYAHLMDDPLRAATERVGAIISPQRDAAVVDFKSRA